MADSEAAGDAEAPSVRDARHEALSVFLGSWQAKGVSYGSACAPSPGRPEPWTSTHTARWHTGEFFLVQDERATVGEEVFDTLTVMGVDPGGGRYFAQCFENHGFARRYDVSVDGAVWTFSGEHERARIAFSEDGRTQTIRWERKTGERWLPLCDRVATRLVLDEVRP